MKLRSKKFWTMCIAFVLAVALTVPASATLYSKTIGVYTGATIYIDGVEMKPTDVNGNPVETFIHNGTTYVPLRAVSQSMGKAVDWDGENHIVYIGKKPGDSQYLLDVCPPYQTERYTEHKTVDIAGKTYADRPFSIGRDYYYDNDGYALFNLDGQYDTLCFTVGHIDGKQMDDSSIDIYLDGKLSYTVELTAEMMPTYYEFALKGALQMKIVGNEYAGMYAIFDAVIG